MEIKQDIAFTPSAAEKELRKEIIARIDDDAWMEYANTRQFNIIIRWTFGVLLGVFLTNFGVTIKQAFVWMLIMSTFLVLDYFAAIKLGKNPSNKSARIELCISEFLAVSSYSLIAPLGWFYGEPAAKLCVLLYFSGALATHSSSTQRLPVIRALMLAPYYTLIPMLFSIDAYLAPEGAKSDAIYLAIISLLGMLYFSFVFRQSIKNSRKYEKALLDQEIARIRAENANMAKSRFISAVSHDLRTPLNAIIGSARLLKNYDKDAENRDLLGVLIESGESMTYLLNEIIDSNILETGSISISPKPFSPQGMLNACADLWERPIGQKNLEFICDYHNNLPETLYGDEKNIRRIINNLLSSALKNTKLGWICLRAEHKDGQFIIEVCDSGAGFPEKGESDETILKSEFKGTKQYSGIGIGLNNSAHLAKLMGGTIEIESVLHNGSRILVSVPAEITNENLQSEQIQEDFDASNLKSLEVLIADDNKNSRFILRKFLEAAGANITEAENGESAEMLAKEKAFNFIFLDAKMPLLSGIEACRKIREGNGINSDVPIFIMSADADLLKKALKNKVGADGFISKPFGPRDIVNLVEQPKQKRNIRLQ